MIIILIILLIIINILFMGQKYIRCYFEKLRIKPKILMYPSKEK